MMPNYLQWELFWSLDADTTLCLHCTWNDSELCCISPYIANNFFVNYQLSWLHACPRNIMKQRLFLCSIETSAGSLTILWTVGRSTHDHQWASVRLWTFEARQTSVAVDLSQRELPRTLQWIMTLKLGMPSCFTPLFLQSCFTSRGLVSVDIHITVQI
jgi:hypothetical protein